MFYNIFSQKKHYLCSEFFMVLDFKVNQDWLSGGNQFFYYPIPDKSFCG
jgi:hypothetical protein